MRFAAILFVLGLIQAAPATAQSIGQPGQCSGVVQCAEALVSATNRLAAENQILRNRIENLERRMQRGGQTKGMQTGAVRVDGSPSGYRETTIFFKPPFRSPPSVFLSARDVNVRDHQQLWVKSITPDRAVIASCRRHNNPERCLAFADDFHFDWIAVNR